MVWDTTGYMSYSGIVFIGRLKISIIIDFAFAFSFTNNRICEVFEPFRNLQKYPHAKYIHKYNK